MRTDNLRFLGVFLLGLMVVVVLALVNAGAHSVSRCEEDQACWNCKTMGNKICGPVVEVSSTVVEAAK